MPQNLTDDKSTLVQVMAWCRQATSHYLNQCWPRSPTPYGITRPQWVNWLINTSLAEVRIFQKNHCKAIPWLMMPWLLASPGHQQPCYWICLINNSMPSMRTNYCITMCVIWVLRNHSKCKYIFMFLEKEIQHIRVKMGTILPSAVINF